MVFILPGPASVQVPAAIPGLRIAYSRNIETFHVNQMMQRISHDKVVGLYLRIDIDEGVRIVDARTEANWPDNVVRPAAFEAKHEFETFRMARHSEAFQFGILTVDQATWPIMQDRTAMAAEKQMTRKTLIFEELVTDTTNGVQHFDIEATVGGNWVGSDTANQFILKTKNQGVKLIQDATNGRVRETDIIAAMSKATANVVGESPEYQDWLKRTQGQVTFDALRRSVGMHPAGMVEAGGLYGLPVAVFDEQIVTSPEGATKVRRGFFEGLGVIDSKDVFSPVMFMVRQGGLEGLNVAMGNEAQPVNSQTTIASVIEIWKEDMTVEAEVKDFDRLTKGAVTTNFDMVLGTPSTVVIAGDAQGESV